MTLVEVLVATSLLAVVVGALMPILTVGQQTWDHAHRRVEMIQNSRIALDHLADKLRAAQTFSVVSATNIRFTYFYGNGVAIPTNEYRLNTATNELEYRWDPDPFLPLAGAFRSMAVTCFNDAGATVGCASAASVRAVQVALVAMDPQGIVADITVTTRAFRQAP
jgi:type II secretory pathway pseudopilin PulG